MRAVHFLAWCAVGTFAVGACGGRTISGDEGAGGTSGGSGGSGAFGGSMGGAAGGGMAGMAGGGMAGGGMGGMPAGGGGMPAGGGGMPGGAGGMPGGGGSTSIWQKVEKICNAINQLPCKLPNCFSELAESVKMADSQGCSHELETILDCALSYPLVCKGGEPVLPPQCDKAQYFFEECIGSDPGCGGWASSDGSCGVSCGYFDVACKPLPNGGLQCLCETGPAKGKLFKVGGSCGSPNFENTVTTYCG